MTLDPGYFRDRYAASPDPYGLAERWYEARKYALSVALLPTRHYGTAFEPGCSIGVLTTKLAPRCGTLLACDAIPDAVASAQARTAGLPGVRVEQRVIPTEWPPHSFDLIVFSELLYYFGDADLDQVLRLGAGALRPGGHVLAVHWRHPAPNHPRTGDEVHQALAGHPGLARLAGYRDLDFAAEVYADRVIRTVGVIVPAHDEEELLPSCLASLRRHELRLPPRPERPGRAVTTFHDFAACRAAAAACRRLARIA